MRLGLRLGAGRKNEPLRVSARVRVRVRARVYARGKCAWRLYRWGIPPDPPACCTGLRPGIYASYACTPPMCALWAVMPQHVAPDYVLARVGVGAAAGSRVGARAGAEKGAGEGAGEEAGVGVKTVSVRVLITFSIKANEVGLGSGLGLGFGLRSGEAFH